MDRILTSTTTLGQSGSGSDGNERVLWIPQIPAIRLFSVISRTHVGRALPTVIQLVYSADPADWAKEENQ